MSSDESGLTLDAGALIGIERRDRFTATLVRRALERKLEVVVPAGVLAQVWRSGRRQAGLARLLATPELSIVALDGIEARRVGELLSITGTRDVVDASVVLCARRRRHRVLTSDPDDLLALDPDLPVTVV